MVWREKYSATGASIALSSSSVVVAGEKWVQSRAVSASAPGMPSAARRAVRSCRLGTRAFPPRSPNDT